MFYLKNIYNGRNNFYSTYTIYYPMHMSSLIDVITLHLRNISGS